LISLSFRRFPFGSYSYFLFLPSTAAAGVVCGDTNQREWLARQITKIPLGDGAQIQNSLNQSSSSAMRMVRSLSKQPLHRASVWLLRVAPDEGGKQPYFINAANGGGPA